MKLKITLKRLLPIISFAVIIFSAMIFFLVPVLHGSNSDAKPVIDAQILPNIVEDKPIAPIVVAKKAIPALPMRLKIPEINVDAFIEQVGLKANGEMEVPKDSLNVGWLKISQRPGDIGSAVIAGHFGVLKNGEASVFDNLKKLNKGDQLYIEDGKGATVTFVVREKRSYDTDVDASNVFTSSDGKSHLNLVTCQSWDKVSESYSKRLVVFADKE